MGVVRAVGGIAAASPEGFARRACVDRRAIDGNEGLDGRWTGEPQRRPAASGSRGGAFCWPPPMVGAMRSCRWIMTVGLAMVEFRMCRSAVDAGLEIEPS